MKELGLWIFGFLFIAGVLCSALFTLAVLIGVIIGVIFIASLIGSWSYPILGWLVGAFLLFLLYYTYFYTVGEGARSRGVMDNDVGFRTRIALSCMETRVGIYTFYKEAKSWMKTVGLKRFPSAINAIIGIATGDEDKVWHHLCLKRAESGDVDCQYTLGRYCIGWFVDGFWPEDAPRRIGGKTRAYKFLGSRIAFEGVRWFEKAAEQGHVRAMGSLGYCLANGDGCRANPTKAVKLLEIAAEFGDEGGQEALGDLLSFGGEGVPVDKERGCEWWQKAAEQGSKLAMTRLFEAYGFGEGVPQNDVRALMWWRLLSPSALLLAPIVEIIDRTSQAQKDEANKLAQTWAKNFEFQYQGDDTWEWEILDDLGRKNYYALRAPEQ
jgi:hypothetical protein